MVKSVDRLTVSASCVGAFLHTSENMTKTDAMRSTILRLLGLASQEEGLDEKNFAMQRGNNLEWVAMERFAEDMEVKVTDAGEEQKVLYASLDGVPVSATPDGFFVKDGKTYLVEVKCPISANRVSLASNPQYIDQIQMQLYCANKNGRNAEGCYFFSFFQKSPTKPEYVKYNPNHFTALMKSNIQSAWAEMNSILKDKDALDSLIKQPKIIIEEPEELKELLEIEKKRDELKRQRDSLISIWKERYGEGNKIIYDLNGNIKALMTSSRRYTLDKKAMLDDGIVLKNYERPSGYSDVKFPKKEVQIDDYLSKRNIDRKSLTEYKCEEAI